MATQASLNTIQSLYVAYYGRPADPAGLEFWANLLDQAEGDLSGIINAFGTSTEYTNRFGGNTPEQAVNNLYQQLFGRDAEEEGLNFHVNLITSGQKTLAEIALQISIGAQGGDRTVLDGRTAVANAFTRELDTPEEVNAYSTDRGVLIGQNYLKLVTEQNPASVVLRDAAPVVKTLLPETEPETPPGGGGGEPPLPLPTFTAVINGEGTVEFGGTQTGIISLSSENGTWTFTQGTLTATLLEENVSSIALNTAELSAEANVLDNVAVTGSGQITLNNVTNDINLNGLDTSLSVTATVIESLDISNNVNLSTIDTFQVSSGATLTTTLDQHANIQVIGEGALAFSDTIEALTLAANSSTVLDLATSLTITNAASITQLSELSELTETSFSYSTIRDSATNLTNDEIFVTDGITIIVTGVITIDQLTDLKAVVGEDSTVIAENLQDTIAHLISNGTVDSHVTAGSNVTVIGNASVEEITLLDEANGDGNLTYALLDSYENILAENAANVVSNASDITLTSYNLGARTVADIQALLALANVKASDGTTDITINDLTYTLLDTSAELSSSEEGVAEIVSQATSVTASDEAYVYQARVIYERDNNATYDITDNASSILSTSEGTAQAVLQAGTITANNNVTAAIAVELYSIRAGANTVYSITDYYSNITGVAANAVNGATNLTNYTYLHDITEAQNLVNFTNSGFTDIGYLRDTVSDINTFLASNERSDTLRYNFNVLDTSSNILTAIGNSNNDFITGNPAPDFLGNTLVGLIEVTDTFDVNGAETFWSTVDPIFGANDAFTADKTYYVVRDDILDYTNEVAARPSIIGADLRIIVGTAEDIHQAQRGTLIDNRDIFTKLTGSDYMIVSGSAGNQTIQGAPGSDTINAGADNDVVYGGTGSDHITGGTGFDWLYGQDGRDTIYAGANAANTTASPNEWWQSNKVIGGQGGDQMFGSTEADIFIYEGNSRAELVAESTTTSSARDYISNFYLGDKIQFENADSVQFFSSGSANAYSVEAGTLGLSIRYEKDASVLNWQGNAIETASRIFVDIADDNGQFDDIADMHIILVGSNIDINWDGSYLTFGG